VTPFAGFGAGGADAGGELVLRRENQYIEGAQDVLDRTYGWGLNWRAGRK
jgi:tellurite resistance protein TerA